MNREMIVNLVLVGGLGLTALVAAVSDEPFIVTLATKVAIFALAGTGLNIALGLGGLVSFGHAAFFGIGGYAAGILSSHAQTYQPLAEWPFLIEGTTMMPVIWVVAIAACFIAAIIIGAFSLRTGGVYFIMITLAFAQMVYYFAISWPAYGGEDGLSIYVRNRFPGLNTLDPLTFFAICYVILLAALVYVKTLSGARFGLVLKAARQNPQRVTATGMSIFGVRLSAFVVSAMMTGLAGALYADLNRFVSPSMLSWHTSGEIMIFVILGGVGWLCGPVAGAALFILLEHNLGSITEYWQFLLGLLLLLVVLYARGGIVGVLAGGRRDG